MLAAERPLADSAFTTALRGSAFGPDLRPVSTSCSCAAWVFRRASASRSACSCDFWRASSLTAAARPSASACSFRRASASAFSRASSSARRAASCSALSRTASLCIAGFGVGGGLLVSPRLVFDDRCSTAAAALTTAVRTRLTLIAAVGTSLAPGRGGWRSTKPITTAWSASEDTIAVAIVQRGLASGAAGLPLAAAPRGIWLEVASISLPNDALLMRLWWFDGTLVEP